MNRRLLFPATLAAACLTFAAFRGAPAPVAQDDDTQLAIYMKDINRGLRSLRATLRDPSRNEESIETARKLQMLGLQVKGEKPALLADIPKDQHAAFLVEYHKQLIPLVKGFLDLEMALLDGDLELAKELHGKLNDMKKPAHEKFRVKD